MSSDFTKAFYIKLGRGGSWENDAVRTGRLRFGWDGQSIADINAGEWGKIENQLRVLHRGKPQVATNDLNRLRDLVESEPADVWVTFHQSKTLVDPRLKRPHRARRTVDVPSDRGALERQGCGGQSAGRQRASGKTLTAAGLSRHRVQGSVSGPAEPSAWRPSK
jgi:hypothetical protein